MSASALLFAISSLSLCVSTKGDYKLQCKPRYGCEIIPCGSVQELPRNGDSKGHHLDCKQKNAHISNDDILKIASGESTHGFQCGPLPGCTFKGCEGEAELAHIPGLIPALKEREYYISCKSITDLGVARKELLCKPRPKCDFSYCDPLSEALLQLEGFNPEYYRKTESYNIVCQPWSSGDDADEEEDDTCEDKEMNKCSISRSVSLNQRAILELEKEIRVEPKEVEELRTEVKRLNSKIRNMVNVKELSNARREMEEACSKRIEEVSKKFNSKFEELKESISNITSVPARVATATQKPTVAKKGICKILYAGMCYWVEKGRVDATYETSLQKCTSLLGSPADITDAFLYQQLIQYIRTNILAGNEMFATFWTGMTYTYKSGFQHRYSRSRKVFLSTGEEASFVHWSALAAELEHGSPTRIALVAYPYMFTLQLEANQGMTRVDPRNLLDGIICQIPDE